MTFLLASSHLAWNYRKRIAKNSLIIANKWFQHDGRFFVFFLLLFILGNLTSLALRGSTAYPPGPFMEFEVVGC